MRMSIMSVGSGLKRKLRMHKLRSMIPRRNWQISRRNSKKQRHLRVSKPAQIVEALAKRKEAMANKQWYEKFRWFTTSDGFLVVAGKDTVSNEVLIKKYTKQEDVVFHAEITGSPFVVIKAEGKEISEADTQGSS